MSDDRFDILAIGEVMGEITQDGDGDFKIGFAGDTYNTAVYCARLLPSNKRVGYFSRVGRDPLSHQFADVAKLEKLDVSCVGIDDEKPIGLYAVATDAQGERSFSYWRNNSAARVMFDGGIELPEAHVIYLSGITLAILSPSVRSALLDVLRQKSQAQETLVVFDSNYRPRLWESKAEAQRTMQKMWEIADIALPSIDDEMALFADDDEAAVIARFAQKPWKACAIKRGERGPVSLTLDCAQLPAFQPALSIVDTTAAGDSFNAGYLAAFLNGDDEAACLVAGHELASKVVGVQGALLPI